MTTANFELRHLRYFAALAEELHFGRAARRCNVSQPPFSVAIRQLESELGFQLVDRSHSPLKLTPAGAVFYDEAARALSQVQQAAQTADRVSKGLAGVLRVGFFASMLSRGLPDVLRHMGNARPDLEVRLVELSTREQIAAVQRGVIDYGFVHTSVAPAGIHCDPLLSEPFVLCVHERHWAAAAKEARLAAFQDEEFILFPRPVSPTYYDQVISLCVSAGFQPFIRHEVRHWLTVIACVASGIGVALVPWSLQYSGIANVRFLPLHAGMVESPLWGAWLEDAADNSALLAFRNAVKAFLHA